MVTPCSGSPHTFETNNSGSDPLRHGLWWPLVQRYLEATRTIVIETAKLGDLIGEKSSCGVADFANHTMQ